MPIQTGKQFMGIASNGICVIAKSPPHGNPAADKRIFHILSMSGHILLSLIIRIFYGNQSAALAFSTEFARARKNKRTARAIWPERLSPNWSKLAE